MDRMLPRAGPAKLIHAVAHAPHTCAQSEGRDPVATVARPNGCRISHGVEQRLSFSLSTTRYHAGQPSTHNRAALQVASQRRPCSAGRSVVLSGNTICGFGTADKIR
jgi:hypothetical protein